MVLANDRHSSFLLLSLAPGGRSVQIGLEPVHPTNYGRSRFQPMIKASRKLFRFHFFAFPSTFHDTSAKNCKWNESSSSARRLNAPHAAMRFALRVFRAGETAKAF
jgi:hypothetical protein